MPHFRNANLHRVQSLGWVTEDGRELSQLQVGAAMQMFAKHHAEREAKRQAGSPAAE